MRNVFVSILLIYSTYIIADDSFMRVTAKNMDSLESQFDNKLDKESNGKNILLHWDFDKAGGQGKFYYLNEDGKCHNMESKIRDIIYYNNKLKNWFQFNPDKTYGTVYLTCESTFPANTRSAHFKCGGNLERHGNDQECYVDQKLSTFTEEGLEFFGGNDEKSKKPEILDDQRIGNKDIRTRKKKTYSKSIKTQAE